jgi:rod shape-determining protein MreC
MQQIINFFIRNKNLLLFVFLLFVSLFFTFQTHSFHKSKVVNSANFFTGGILSVKNDITGYFGLRKENQQLLEENKKLRNQLQLFHNEETRVIDSSVMDVQFRYLTAEVINNNYSKTNNYLTLKAGTKHGIASEMGVITSNGIVGIVDQVSKNYATVLSILNSKSSISVKFKNSGHFGSLVWNGKEPNTLQLIDISRLANFTIGDTITTDGRSTIFPKDIPVGTVAGFTTDQSGNYYIIDVALFNDMTGLQNVYVIDNQWKEEREQLESHTSHE